ncbi:hypothetical protein SAMD00019534_099050 [Acytostelium subglobosum LB1]|uniref:hypothetical protein n=1 Tax=Acytostelium subglobosum LB1 TaxID=1410327 RepID=UPI000644ECB4|nr:hypothetical protein SAMD00019534_099050 [Acytostelium subglobosum LB1]GAM26730.1 hypothetical protein SAMD00019534_099050 [Acytostelium subglobosum LB1]|eukprot:XP_012750391.1 hypothetical protein SAMD00019534_099050 [Acytostelium subglobosum LB1]
MSSAESPTSPSTEEQQQNNTSSLSSQLHQSTQIVYPPNVTEITVYSVLYGHWGYWPGRAARPSEVAQSVLRGCKKDQFLVYFFGSNDYGFVKDNHIKAYCSKELMQQKLKAADMKKMTKAIDCAEQWINAKSHEFPVHHEVRKVKKEVDHDYSTPTKPRQRRRAPAKPSTAAAKRKISAVKQEKLSQQRDEEIVDNDTSESNDSSSMVTPTKRSPLQFLGKNNHSPTSQYSTQGSSTSSTTTAPANDGNLFSPLATQSITPLSHKRKQLDFHPPTPYKQPPIKQEPGAAKMDNEMVEAEMLHLLALHGPITIEELRAKVTLPCDNMQRIVQVCEKIACRDVNDKWSLTNDRYSNVRESWHGYQKDEEKKKIRKRKQDSLAAHLAQSRQEKENGKEKEQADIPSLANVEPVPVVQTLNLTTTTTTTTTTMTKTPGSRIQVSSSFTPLSPKAKKKLADPLLDLTPIKPRPSLTTNSNTNTNTDNIATLDQCTMDSLQPNAMDTTIPLLDDVSAPQQQMTIDSFEEEEDEDDRIVSTQNGGGSSSQGSQKSSSGITSSQQQQINTTINNIYFSNNNYLTQQTTPTPPTPPPSHNLRPPSTPYSSPGIPPTLVVVSPSNKKRANYYASPDDSDGDYIAPTIPINFNDAQTSTTTTSNKTAFQHHNGSTVIIDQTQLRDIVNDSDHIKSILKESLKDLFSNHFKQHAMKDLRGIIDKEVAAKINQIKEDIVDEFNSQLGQETKKRKKSIQTVIHSLTDIEQSICSLKQNLERLIER